MADNHNNRKQINKNFRRNGAQYKRTPRTQRPNPNTILVNTKSNLKLLEEKCITALNGPEKHILIQCLGAAIPRGILLSLKLCEKINCTVDPNTFTAELIDDLEPTNEEEDYEIQRRLSSGLRIKVTQTSLSA